MTKSESSYLNSKECICGEKFEKGEDKARHCKKCCQYQEYKNKYLTFDNINNFLNVERHTRIELFQNPIYNKICYSDLMNFIKKNIVCKSYIKVNDGTLLTLDEIKSILNKEYLYQRYVIEKKDAIDICNELNNKFTAWTVLEWIKKYGIPRRNSSEAAKNSLIKMQKTCMEKYGFKNASMSDDIKQLKKQTCLKNLGVEHPQQSQLVREKSLKTLNEKYGVTNISQVSEIKDKKEITCLENHGVKNIFCDKDYIKQRIIDLYGTDNISKLDYIKVKKMESYKTYSQNGVAYSKISVDLFNNITSKFDDNISKKFQYATHGGECYFLQNNRICSIDFVYEDEKHKIAIEFNGDVWHANPKKYKWDDKPNYSKPNLLAKDIWKNDEERHNLIKSKGYNLKVVWESDYTNDSDKVINECCDFINQNCI